jgi:hypothetical protein
MRPRSTIWIRSRASSQGEVPIDTKKLIHHACAVSPGATYWKSQRSRSPWRAFSFAFHQLTQAIQLLHVGVCTTTAPDVGGKPVFKKG